MTLTPGQAFGNYRILSRIGVGGMGMVFLAEHPQIGKKVALKIIHRELAGNKEVVSRFLNEARAVNAIGNEHIVEIHDFGQTDDGEHFFIMEYLDGRTLADDLTRDGCLQVPRALHIGAQIASGLGAAHERSIIHRDLKPDNVMLVPRLGDPDFVVLLDFGLAKFLSELDARQLTAAGVVLGTPQFMSPEACESKAVDHRSDIYSLGILLFQMLTGRVPFSGESMGEVLVKQVAQPPPAPRGINPDIPPAVEQVVLRCLAKDPAARFQTMHELRDALLDPQGYLASSPPVMPVAAASPQDRTLFASPGARRRTSAPPPDDHRATLPEGHGPAPGHPAPAAAAARTRIADPGAADAAGAPPEAAAPPAAGPGEAAQAAAATRYMDDAAHRVFAGQVQRDVPQPVENRTMMIGTPHGYVNHPPRPPRRLWPLLLALVLLLAAGAITVVLVVRPDLLGGAAADEAGAGASAVSADAGGARGAGAGAGAAAGAGAGAQAATTTAAGTDADAGPRLAHIHLTTRPSGAGVYDGEGHRLGSTPTEIALPIDGREVVLVFRHPEATETEKRFVPGGDTAFDIELPPATVRPGAALSATDAGPAGAGAPTTPTGSTHPHPSPRHHHRSSHHRRKDELLRPSF